MRALQANFTILGICMCSTELLLWENQKRWSRYPTSLQKRDSIADIFSGADLRRGHRKRGLNRLNFKKRIRSPDVQNLPPRGVLQNHCVKSAQIRSMSPYSVRMQENTDQKKLRIRTLFTQWIVFLNIFTKTNLMHYM